LGSTPNGVQYNQATTAVGYNSSSDKRVYFGLGNATRVDRIELAWPTGVKQVLENVAADQILTIVESGRSQRAGSTQSISRPVAIKRTDRFENLRAGKDSPLAPGGKFL